MLRVMVESMKSKHLTTCFLQYTEIYHRKKKRERER